MKSAVFSRIPASTDSLRGARVFDSDDSPADPSLVALLEDGVKDADLAAPPVVLPDFYHKSNMEMPSSITVATRETIRPTLTSAEVNCGMALVALEIERPSRAAISAFYRQVRERYPFPAPYRRDLTAADVLCSATEGARFAVERFDVDPAELDRIEEGGRLALEPYGGADRLRRELPMMVVQLARMRFGSVGPSNHFIELQEVEEILDRVAAARLGVRAGQVTLQYHAGGGALTTLLGGLFGRRLTTSPKLRVVTAVQKPLFHLASARSLAQLRLRLALYFSRGCPPVARDSVEGQRLLLANAAAMNYGFAYRQATYAILRKLAREVFGGPSRLVVDSPHNSIYEEEVDGEPALVHRHDTSRAFPASKMAGHPVFGEIGQPLLLPGTNRTSSYLCVAAEGASRSLYSACHGAGTIVQDFVNQGLSRLDPGRHTTLRFRYAGTAPVEVPQFDDAGIRDALGILTGHNLVRPVARMRPFAVLT